MNQLLQQPIFQITLPLMVTFVAAIWIASWSQNKRFDDLNRRLDDLRSDMNRRFDDVNRRFDAVDQRLGRIEKKQDDHETRITRVEERTSPIATR